MVRVRDVIAAIEEAGWVHDHTTGDHRIYIQPRQPGQVTVSGKLSQDLQEGTLSAICRQAGIDKTTLKRGSR